MKQSAGFSKAMITCRLDGALPQDRTPGRDRLRPGEIAMNKVSIMAVCLALISLMPIAAFAQKSIGMANPASVHCGEIGGRLVIRKDKAGNEYGFCRLPKGRLCEEWALFRDNKCIGPKVAMRGK
jgi:putative hemolysin